MAPDIIGHVNDGFREWHSIFSIDNAVYFLPFTIFRADAKGTFKDGVSRVILRLSYVTGS